jgi:2'-hydroxyisoflavone reductase
MRLLILGGTRFLGRHIVDAAVARGHRVTTFTRGNEPTHVDTAVVPLGGNRDPSIAPGLAPLATGEWDAVIDTSGYVPRIVGASAELLADRTSRYIFVSSMSVYASSDRPGLDESAPRAVLADPATEEVATHYGALKAACEDAVCSRLGTRATIVRPGLIVGPFDPTDRFAYWVARFIQPALLGDRPAEAVVPAPPERPLQFIDARDLGEWLVGLAERDTPGTFNAASERGHFSWGGLVDALTAVARESGLVGAAGIPTARWLDDATLAAHQVSPWTGLPLWLPASEADHAGFLEFDCRRAHAAGLAERALEYTIRDTADWLVERPNEGAWRLVLTAGSERAILGSGRI